MSSGELLRVNAAEEAVLLDFAGLCAPSDEPTDSPIDEYYRHARSIILASTTADEWLLRLLLLDLISAAESYFRRVLSGAINACSLSRDVAARQNLSLAAVDYYGKIHVGLGLLENAALSAEGELKRRTKAITGIDIKNGTSVDIALADFEQICHLRHAAVHAKGELGSRNLAELGVRLPGRQRLRLDRLTFQPIVVRCQSAVRAFNQFLFSGLLARWIEQSRFVGKWDADAAAFSALHALFLSTVDPVIHPNASAAYDAILPTIAARLAK